MVKTREMHRREAYERTPPVGGAILNENYPRGRVQIRWEIPLVPVIVNTVQVSPFSKTPRQTDTLKAVHDFSLNALQIVKSI
jgi:hypothetical protein